MEEVGIHLHSANWDIVVPINVAVTYTHTLGVGISWSIDMAYSIPIFLPDDTSWTLKIKRGATTWSSPPLVIQPVTGEKNLSSQKSGLAGIDRTTYLLSRLGTDKPTYSKTTADVIINSLAGDVGVTVTGAPTYKVFEYDAHEGKIIDHISDLLAKGGKTFRIASNGNLECIDMTISETNSYGMKWISDVSWAYDPSVKKSRQQFIKASKVRNAYDYRWLETGELKSGTFDEAMVGVQVYDKSLIGYIDEVGLYDASSRQVGPIILFHPEDHEGATFSPSESSDPVLSFLLTVYPAKDDPTNSVVDARARFVGTLYSDGSGYDESFDATETPSPLFGYYITQPCRIDYNFGTDNRIIDLVKLSNNYGTWFYKHGVFLESTDDVLQRFNWTTINSITDIGAASTTTNTEADRPADTIDYVDCSIMPTLVHCNSVKKSMLYNDIKRQYSITYSGPKILFELEPGVKIEYHHQPDSIVNAVTLSREGIKAECYPEVWW